MLVSCYNAGLISCHNMILHVSCRISSICVLMMLPMSANFVSAVLVIKSALALMQIILALKIFPLVCRISNNLSCN